MQFVGILEMSTLLTLAGLCAAAVTVLYILKLRKRRIEVPFSPLWREVLLEHKQQSDLWRKLRRFFSWLLHLLLVALLALAIADPHSEDEVIQGRHIVLLIDSSASMAATDVSGGADRLDVAKKKAREILDTMGPDDRVMLVNFNNQVQPLSPFVGEASLLEQPLRDIRVAATPTEYVQAIAFGADSLRDQVDGELVIITDGASVDATALNAIEFGEQTTVRHLKVGESTGNVAITAFNVRRYLANKQDFELFLKVQSYFDRPIQAEVQIFADETLVDTKPISLEPHGTYQQFYPSQAVAGEQLEARVKVTSVDARDVFELDDRAYALLPEVQTARVEVVTEGNLYLEGPLILNPNLDVTRTAPDAWVDKPGEFDAVFFDRVTPALPATGNFFLLDPHGEHSPWEERGVQPDPIITQVRRTHPLMRWITLADANIATARRLRMESRDQVVASSIEGTPILFARTEESGRRLIGLSFDVRNSDLPLRVAFPVLLLNAIDWFNADDASLVESYKSGEAWSVPLKSAAATATVTTPLGTSYEVPIFDGAAVVYGDATGFYELRTPEQTVRVAANLVAPAESAIAPSDLEFPSTETVHDASSLLFDRNEIWIWLVLVVFALLLLEWTTYNRRITV